MSSDRELRKGSAETLILALLEERDRHGYEIAKLIGDRSDGAITFHVASLYPALYRLERRGLIHGRWVEQAGMRRRRFYRLTAAGRKVLDAQRRSWSTFFAALNRVAHIRHASLENARPRAARRPPPRPRKGHGHRRRARAACGAALRGSDGGGRG